MKLIWLIVLGCIAWKLATGRWPWNHLGYDWPASKGSGKAGKASGFAQIHEQAQARALLGVPEGASREVILEAHRKRLIAIHPDRGGSNEKVHEANAARDLLLGQIDSGARA